MRKWTLAIAFQVLLAIMIMVEAVEKRMLWFGIFGLFLLIRAWIITRPIKTLNTNQANKMPPTEDTTYEEIK